MAADERRVEQSASWRKSRMQVVVFNPLAFRRQRTSIMLLA